MAGSSKSCTEQIAAGAGLPQLGPVVPWYPPPNKAGRIDRESIYNTYPTHVHIAYWGKLAEVATL